MSLTGEEIISGIAIKLRAEFTTTEIPAIYKDTPTQTMLKPSIFINNITTTHTPEMNEGANRNYLIDIIVVGSEDNTALQTWFTTITERVFSAVDYITVSGKPLKMARGETNLEDDELHIIVTYDMKVIKELEDGIKMRKQKTNERVI